MQYQSGVFTKTLMDLYSLCHQQIPSAAVCSKSDDTCSKKTSESDASTTVAVTGQKRHAIASSTTPKKKDQVVSALQGISSALITTMKVLVNLTHSSRKLGLGSKTLGAQPRTYQITLRYGFWISTLLIAAPTVKNMQNMNNSNL